MRYPYKIGIEHTYCNYYSRKSLESIVKYEASNRGSHNITPNACRGNISPYNKTFHHRLNFKIWSVHSVMNMNNALHTSGVFKIDILSHD